MTVDFVIGIAAKTLEVAVIISAPMLLFGLLAGLIISIFQAVTQIQEMTLTFVPKILAVVIAAVIFMPFILNTLIDFAYRLFVNLYLYVGK
jgi:flagellar biosynthetic protein FliQ